MNEKSMENESPFGDKRGAAKPAHEATASATAVRTGDAGNPTGPSGGVAKPTGTERLAWANWKTVEGDFCSSWRHRRAVSRTHTGNPNS